MTLHTGKATKTQLTQALGQAWARRVLESDTLGKARSSLLDFTLFTKPDYIVNWHHRVIAEALDRVVEGKCKRLMIFTPPRYGKSQLVSRHLPAYALGRNPDLQIIGASHTADFARGLNRDVQRIIDSEEYRKLFPDTRLWGKNIRADAQGVWLRNSDIFEIIGHRGYYRGAGIGGAITGMGFDLGIIDDPFKDRKQANSLTIRRAHWEWYTSTFYTRQQRNAAIVLVMTLWNMDDLAGRLKKLMNEPDDEFGELLADQWEIISLPALATENRISQDPRQPGEALWPHMHTEQQLRSRRKNMGDYDFAALYQQNPMPDGGGLFKREKFMSADHKALTAPPADIVKTVRFWDTATSEKKSADYTVGVKLGQTKGGEIIILDVRRFQRDWDVLPEAIEKVAIEDGRAVLIGVEKAFFQSRIVKKLLQRPALSNFSIKGYAPDTDKFTRALPFAARVSEDMVYVLDRAWTQDYIDEMCAFPQGAHDDQVDASSGAYFMLDGGPRPLDVRTQVYA